MKRSSWRQFVPPVERCTPDQLDWLRVFWHTCYTLFMREAQSLEGGWVI